MTYKEFKKTVLNYFQEHSYVKNRVLKKALKFEKPTPIKTKIGLYKVNFEFFGEALTLTYGWNTWDLTFQDKKRLEICNIGKTINECCDYLWKLKR